MFIAIELHRLNSAPLGAKCMSLLTELQSYWLLADYKHCAPSGAKTNCLPRFTSRLLRRARHREAAIIDRHVRFYFFISDLLLELTTLGAYFH
jgi:hypothetical protein